MLLSRRRDPEGADSNSRHRRSGLTIRPGWRSRPIVLLVLPAWAGAWYLPVAETFAPLFECLLFAALFPEGRNRRDMAAILAANVASFAWGELLFGALRLGTVR